ncbi:TonB-dependent receptor [Lutibacter oricola]|uniref:TonB-dependent receptor n=1 Tax=Lutibacter oricola TaxID=762486 RepID=A0A1H3ACG7_9FLAO|nr:TonB-dependent receptor [Lutibacter oricola]SDX27265.1 TonB-dependent receptor [Lutibacter oricola]
MKKITVLLCSLIITITAFSQSTGIISGVVTDSKGLPLPGASVIIEELKTGSYTGFDGKYNVLNVTNGTHELIVTYLGYETIKEKVTINNDSKVINFKLKVSTNRLNEVVLKGSMAQGQAKALNQQKANTHITNVVASDQVGKFPDANIGEALKRIPGISMQNDQGEARNIVIRGIAPQLNSVMLNGDRIPSAEGDNRNVQMDLIPADMIQVIEVNKAITSDMEADAIGGAVNLITRTAPSNFRASLTASYGQNPVRETPLYNISGLISGRTSDDKLGAVVSISQYSNEYGSDNIEFEWDGDFDKPILSDQQIRKYNVKRNRQSISANLDYKFSAKNAIYFKSIYNVRKDWENRYRFRYKGIEEVADGLYEAEVRRQTKGGTEKNARLEEQKVKKVSFKGEHILFNSVELEWKANYSEASEERPNERYISYRNKDVALTQNLTSLEFPEVVPVGSDFNDPTEFDLKEISEENKLTKEVSKGYKMDLDIPLIKTGDNQNKLKIGYKYKDKEKSRDNNYIEYEPTTGLDFLSNIPYSDQTVSGYLAGDKYELGNFADANFLGGLDLNNSILFESEAILEEFVPQNYLAREEVQAAYAMFTQKLGSKFNAIAGVRFEKTNLDYTGYRIDIETAESLDDVEVVSASKNYSNWLPNLQLKYSINTSNIVRLAYSNSIARPNYYDLVPYQNLNSDDLEFEEGNPNLKATESMNLDLMYEKYFSNVGIFSAGVFYKDLDNWIYTYREDDYVDAAFPTETFEYSQPRNGKTASILGFEVSLQRKLNFLPGFLRNLNLYLNYTYTNSETDGIEGREDVALAGAVENMFNGSLAYETDKFLMRASVNFADDYIDEYGDEAFEDRYYDSQLFLDVNASYEVLTGLRLFTEFKNLTNQELRYYQGTQAQTMQAEWYDFNWNVGLKYNF